MREVAALAGVSTATVSRVLSGGQRTVSPHVAERVRAAADRLGYRTNRVARALRTRSTQTIGLVVPDITNPFFPGVVQAVERELRRTGMSLLLCDSGNDVAEEAHLLRSLLDHQTSGVLISACDRIASRHAVRLAAGQVPLVQLDRVSVDGHYYVGIDQDSVMGALVDHLRDQGCQTFAYISPSTAISTANERMQAFLRHVAPLDARAASRLHIGEFTIEWGYTAARRIWERGPRPDAIVCANDLTAVGALQALHELEVDVPTDVAVSGFDDTVLASVCRPALTTVRQPLDQLGRSAVAMLTAVIADRPVAAPTVTFPAELVVRDSTRRTDRQPAGSIADTADAATA